MLPLEVLSVVFGALSRADLETLMLVNTAFRDVGLRDCAAEPFRYFAELYVPVHRAYEFRFATSNSSAATREQRFTSRNDEDFHQRMRHGRVGTLIFGESPLDEASFDALLPHKDAWRSGHVNTPLYFTSQMLLERAFTELFLCKSIFVFVGDEYEPRRPFLTFPTFWQCTKVDVACSPCLLDAGELVDWLNAPISATESKTLSIRDEHLLDDNVDTVLQRLLEVFMVSTTVAPYHVVLWSNSYDGNRSISHFNGTTNETLNIELKNYGPMRSVAVRRARKGN